MQQSSENGTSFKLGPRLNLVNELAEKIREQILGGQLKPGDKLPTEARLCDLAGVSRTVVREAIAALRAENLVVTRRGAGMFVLVPTPQAVHPVEVNERAAEDMLGILEVRLPIEAEAAAVAARRRTDEDLAHMRQAIEAFAESIRLGNGESAGPDMAFHSALMIATHNRWFVNAISIFGDLALPRSHIPDMGRVVLPREHLEIANLEHQAIYDAVEARDPMQATIAVRVHLGGARVRYKAMMQRAQERAGAPEAAQPALEARQWPDSAFGGDASSISD